MPSSANSRRPWDPYQALSAMRGRLREPLGWFPFPILLPIGLVLLLTGHIVFATNPRMGNPADIITFPSEPRSDSALWLSVTPIGEGIVITTNDRRVFHLPLKMRAHGDTGELLSYLKNRVAREIDAAALFGRSLNSQTTVVIAADQRLKYLHVRPLIQVLADAGITQYAFETQNPQLAVKSPAPAGQSGEHEEREGTLQE